MTNDVPQLPIPETGLALSASNSMSDEILNPVLDVLWPAEQAIPEGGGGFTNTVAPLQEIPPTIREPPDDCKTGKTTSSGEWMWLVIALLAVGGVAWIARKLKAGSIAFEKSAEDELVDSVLDAVGKDVPDRAQLREELVNVAANGGVFHSGPLASILRIEESYEKQPSGRYLRRISVLRRKERAQAALTKIESELGWEYIPEAIRERFIQTREDKVVRLVYDAGKGSGA